MTGQEKWKSRSTILLDRRPGRAAMFSRLRPHVVSSASDVRGSVANAPHDSLWVSYDSHLTAALVRQAPAVPSRFRSGLFLHPLDMRSIPVLSSLFRRIAFRVDGQFLPAAELAEALDAENRANLFIGGFANPAVKTITFWRGDLESLTVPFAAFETSGDGTSPNFDRLAIVDCGQTVKFGKYEAAVDAILYEYDAEYRRAISEQRRQEDRSFGAALRRLRKQRGIRQGDFEPELSAKTIARIEQGKVRRIQKNTLDSLAQRLGVAPGDIASY